MLINLYAMKSNPTQVGFTPGPGRELVTSDFVAAHGDDMSETMILVFDTPAEARAASAILDLLDNRSTPSLAARAPGGEGLLVVNLLESADTTRVLVLDRRRHATSEIQGSWNLPAAVLAAATPESDNSPEDPLAAAKAIAAVVSECCTDTDVLRLVQLQLEHVPGAAVSFASVTADHLRQAAAEAAKPLKAEDDAIQRSIVSQSRKSPLDVTASVEATLTVLGEPQDLSLT